MKISNWLKINDTINDTKGFTLIELMIVMAVVGILVALTIPFINNDSKNLEDLGLNTTSTAGYTAENNYVSEPKEEPVLTVQPSTLTNKVNWDCIKFKKSLELYACCVGDVGTGELSSNGYRWLYSAAGGFVQQFGGSSFPISCNIEDYE